MGGYSKLPRSANKVPRTPEGRAILAGLILQGWRVHSHGHGVAFRSDAPEALGPNGEPRAGQYWWIEKDNPRIMMYEFGFSEIECLERFRKRIVEEASLPTPVQILGGERFVDVVAILDAEGETDVRW